MVSIIASKQSRPKLNNIHLFLSHRQYTSYESCWCSKLYEQNSSSRSRQCSQSMVAALICGPRVYRSHVVCAQAPGRRRASRGVALAVCAWWGGPALPATTPSLAKQVRTLLQLHGISSYTWQIVIYIPRHLRLTKLKLAKCLCFTSRDRLQHIS